MSQDVTQLLQRWSEGDREALDALMTAVYTELRRVANSYLRSERPDHTLQATALVNEAYLRLMGQRGMDWESRAHFFGVAARLMRQILVDHARQHNAAKRGGAAFTLALDEALGVAGESREEVDIVLLDGALERLTEVDPEKARIVELRFFGGLSIDETAAAMGVSPRTVARGWRFAKAWLLRELQGEAPGEAP